jgi:hypothetical protein
MFRFYGRRSVCEKASQRSAIEWAGEWGQRFTTRAHFAVVRCKYEEGEEDFWDFIPADDNGRRYLGDGVYV